MFYRLKTSILKSYFNYSCRSILDTPPIGSQSGGPVIVSQVGNKDLIMYLVAIKSLWHRLQNFRVVNIVHRNCPQKNIDLLQKHVRPWKTYIVEDQGSQRCPQGGTWERILTIARLVEDDYVMQLDADTVTVDTIPEVVECINSGISFMIGTWRGQDVESAAHAAERVKDNPSQHVQMLGEKVLDKLNGADSLRYARGQSSFTGFARNSFSVSKLEEFSENMQQLLGKEKWEEWGSESFASNFFIANSPKTRVLPWPKYSSFNPTRKDARGESSFVHFEGTNRFKDNAYVDTARHIIRELNG